MSYLRLSPNLFQMLAVCVVFSGFLLNSHLAAVAQYLSGTESTSLASSNHSFENELNGWDHTSQLAAQLLVRSWAPDLSDRFEPYFGNNLVRLRGEGSWGQTVPLQAGIQQQVLNGFAFKQSNQSGKAPGFAAVAVTYYDAFWCELDRIVIPIDEKLPNKNRGPGDGLNFYSWGLAVPNGAAIAYLFVYTTEGTDVYVDNLGLFDYTINPPAPISKSLVSHASLDSFLNGCWGYGTEFWESEIDWESGFDGLGSARQPEWVYQFVNMSPNRTYSFFADGNKFGFANLPAGYGIDFYDVHWKHIGKVNIDLQGVVSFSLLGRRITTPPDTAYASVFVWCDTFPGASVSGYRAILSLIEQDNKVDALPSVVAYHKTLRGGKGGTLGASLSVVYSDAQGIDLSSIDANDVYFGSKTDPTKRYPATIYAMRSSDNERLVFVEYLVAAAYYRDVDAMTIQEGQVKNSVGNYVSTKKFAGLTW